MISTATAAAAPEHESVVRAEVAALRVRCRRAARAAAGAREATARCRAARTIPRGASAADADRQPAVSPEVWLLHVRYHRWGDAPTLAARAAEYDRYAVSLAVRLQREHESLDDLRQVAREGLIAALRRFDPDRGLPFPAFATPTIMGALRRHYRDRGWAVRVPRRVHEVAMAARRAEEDLTASLGRLPKVDEVAARLRISVDDLLEVQDALHARNAASIDGHIGHDGERRGISLGEPDPRLARADDRVDLREALGQLDDREREVVHLYFFEEWSQAAIGEHFDVSQMQVSRWLSSILRRLRVQVRVEPAAG
ncbi:MAG TPA: sigma-70 family RNA polymerase sigma factor [Aquihabitans sp.]|nr:sigma-70 family RNA polymerase sigma factor [Aquihabitans sp.]